MRKQCVVFVVAALALTLFGRNIAGEEREIAPRTSVVYCHEAFFSLSSRPPVEKSHFFDMTSPRTNVEVSEKDLVAFRLAGSTTESQKDDESSQQPLYPGFNNFHRVVGYNFTRGLFSKGNLMPLAIGTAGTLIAVFFDEEVSDAVQGSADDWGDAGAVIGGPIVVAASTTALLVATPFVKSERFKGFTFTLAQSLILNNALTFALKPAVSRMRPNEEDDDSFPSGHSSNAFAWSTVVAHFYGKKIGIPALIAAGLISLSRLEHGSHYLSDVIAGSTIGVISGITAVRGSRHYASRRHWTLLPSVGRRQVGLHFYLRF